MLRSDKLGVCCDYCGMALLTEFRYYSLDVFLLSITNNILPRLPRPGNTCTFSFDFCAGCLEKIKNAIKTHYKPTPLTQLRELPSGVFCDLTGEHLSGTFELYYTIISDISVKIPDVITNDDRYLEFNMSSTVFNRIKEKAVQCRTSEAQKWSLSQPQ